MAITVDWPNKVINVPRSYLTLVSGNNYLLDVNQFRLDLRAAEDDPDGMTFPNTHLHNTEVTLGGVTYARLVEIINGYTITFEDGQYAVSLTGANNNILDVVNLNQVSVRSNNSAGLQTVAGGGSGPTALEIAAAVWNTAYASYDTDTTFGHLVNYSKFITKTLFVDTDLVTNGDGSQKSPFNNFNDAVDLAEAEGIRDIHVSGDTILNRNLKNLNITGVGLPEFDSNGFDLKNMQFRTVRLKGQFTSEIVAENCILVTGAFINGFYDNCSLSGDITVVANGSAFVKDCASGIPGTSRPTISMNSGQPSSISVRNYHGGLTINDCDHPSDVITVELGGGSLTFSSSCTAGTMVARGVGKFVDQSAGATVINETISQETIPDAVWNYTQ